jgi:hypothetical protein
MTGYYIRTFFKLFVGKHIRKSPLGRYRRKREDNIETDSKEMWLDMWLHLFNQVEKDWQGIVDTVLKLRIP